MYSDCKPGGKRPALEMRVTADHRSSILGSGSAFLPLKGLGDKPCPKGRYHLSRLQGLLHPVGAQVGRIEDSGSIIWARV